MKIPVVALVASALLFAGCETRSISDADYRYPHVWNQAPNPLYKGELTELDVLGAAARTEVSPEAIAKTLASATPPRLKRGDRVLLIQSGAMVPDNAMIDEAGRYLEVAPFSGVPPAATTGFADSLRVRAAQGGYPYIVCYWGVLESAQLDREGKAVSWVPIVGAFIPDQQQRMRIRLKALVVDVASGSWRMLTPEARDDATWNSAVTRRSADQQLVAGLKEKGYRTLVTSLLN